MVGQKQADGYPVAELAVALKMPSINWPSFWLGFGIATVCWLLLPFIALAAVIAIFDFVLKVVFP
jgi:hypothetical protein